MHYGFSVGRGAFKLASGRWMRVTQRVRINGLGREDGEYVPYITAQLFRDMHIPVYS